MESLVGNLKLTIEWLPSIAHGVNVRKIISQSRWKKIRERVLADYQHQCGICAATEEKMHCHEVWAFDLDNNRQQLKGLMPLCFMCHQIKHIGLAGTLISQGKLSKDDMIQHFMAVNECDQETFQQHYRDLKAKNSEARKELIESLRKGEYKEIREWTLVLPEDIYNEVKTKTFPANGVNVNVVQAIQ